MGDNLFIIAIGGTGMRCLESFIHLCALGMFDDKEINILTLDTDQANGNKQRVENLINVYNEVRDASNASKDTFFSAKLDLKHFVTPYNSNDGDTYKALRSKGIAPEYKDDNSDLAELFYNPEKIQTFNLEEGYRAQTHLGSMLMYIGIIDAATKVAREPKKYSQYLELKTFLDKMRTATTTCRVFVLGSVFGGTGASSIPIIPRAILEAANIIFSVGLEEKVLFGSTLLTSYFKFGTADKETKSRQKVIADASFFALNSQAALNFYNNDKTVLNNYKRFYQIGWPFDPEQYGRNDLSIGGPTQENDSHFIELLAAAAAYDFFTVAEDDLNSTNSVKYLHRMVETDSSGKISRITGKDIFDDENTAKNFVLKLGGMITLSHLILGYENGAWDDSDKGGLMLYLQEFAQNDIPGYKEINTNQARNLNMYLRYFAYEGKANGDIKGGWIYQIKNSLRSVCNNCILSQEAYPKTKTEAKRVNLGGLFTDKSYNWYKEKTGLRRLNFLNQENSFSILKTKVGEFASSNQYQGLSKFLKNFMDAALALERKS